RTSMIEASKAPVRTVRLSIQPADASVKVDGADVVLSEGTVELSGALGSLHTVHLKLGPHERDVEVVIADQGAVPSKVALDDATSTDSRLSGRKARTPGGRIRNATPTSTTTGTLPSARSVPSTTPKQGIGARETFE